MGTIITIGVLLGLITLALLFFIVFEKDKTILKEILSLWLGLAGLSILAFFYTSLTQ